jgi:hypothetical protein
MFPAAACALTALLSIVPFQALAGSSSCAALNDCSGHGACSAGWPPSCLCDTGWGSAGDVTAYRAPDCSARSCPWAGAWADLPRGARQAHAPAECAGAGLCDRATGACRCFAGYVGEACARSACAGAPEACSGNGRCLPLAEFGAGAGGNSSAEEGDGGGGSGGWGAERIHACACDAGFSGAGCDSRSA